MHGHRKGINRSTGSRVGGARRALSIPDFLPSYDDIDIEKFSSSSFSSSSSADEDASIVSDTVEHFGGDNRADNSNTCHPRKWRQAGFLKDTGQTDSQDIISSVDSHGPSEDKGDSVSQFADDTLTPDCVDSIESSGERSPVPEFYGSPMSRRKVLKLSVSAESEIQSAIFSADEYPKAVLESACKRKRPVKGRLVEQLRRLVARMQSDETIRSHVQKDFESRSCLILKVLQASTAFRMSTWLCSLPGSGHEIHVLTRAETLAETAVRLCCGKYIRLTPPWRTFWLADVRMAVLLSFHSWTVLEDENSNLVASKACQDVSAFIDGHLGASDESCEKGGFILPADIPALTELKSPAKVCCASIVEAVERSIVTREVRFRARIRRVFCFRDVSLDPVDDYGRCRPQFINEIAKSNVNKGQDPPRLSLLVQDHAGFCAEVLFTEAACADNLRASLLQTGEGTLCDFSCLQISKRVALKRQARIESVIRSLYPESDPSISVDDDERDISYTQTIQDCEEELFVKCPPSYSYVFRFNENASSVDFLQHENMHPVRSPVLRCSDIRDLWYPTRIPGSSSSRLLRRSVLGFVCALFCDRNGDDEPRAFSLFILNRCQCSTYPFDAKVKELSEGCNSGSQGSTCLRPFRIRVLETCFVWKEILSNWKDALLFFRDVLCFETQLIADQYTRIYRVQAKAENAFTIDLGLDLSSACSVPVIEKLRKSTVTGALCSVSGSICGVDEKTALFWLVCEACSSEDLKENENGDTYCEKCQLKTKAIPKMRLEVFVSSPDLPGVVISVKLLKSTISALLPAPSLSNFEGYDVRTVLNQAFGPSLCVLVDSTTASDSDSTEHAIFLEEVFSYVKYQTF